MRIFVTGGTGFVGSHAVAELVRGGHEVRMLVRSPERMAQSLEPLGIRADEIESSPGDVLDVDSVERAASGCEAALHAAGVYTTDTRRRTEVHDVNVRGTEHVLAAAARLGLDPIVHVSSYVALLPAVGSVLTPDDPVGRPKGHYMPSKAESDRAARALQDSGAPVVIVYPGGVLGPNDPHLGDTDRMILAAFRSGTTIVGGMPLVDVRDVARVLAAVMEPGRGARRYMITGHDVTVADFTRTVREMTGRGTKVTALPVRPARFLGHLADLVQRVVPNHRLSLTYEDTWGGWPMIRCDQSRTAEELGVEPRDLDVTVRETIAWMIDAGHLPSEAATGS